MRYSILRSKKSYFIALFLAVTVFVGAGIVFAGADMIKATTADFKFFVNGKNVQVSEQPVVIDGKTYLPVRALGETMGKRIGWDQKSQTVIIDELLKDGTYKASEPEFNTHGWKALVELGVENGKITTVKYDEVNTEGVYKLTDQEYLQYYKQATQGIDFSVCIESLQTNLINTQHTDMVDVVSGATYSSYSFKALAKQALAAGPVE